MTFLRQEDIDAMERALFSGVQSEISPKARQRLVDAMTILGWGDPRTPWDPGAPDHLRNWFEQVKNAPVNIDWMRRFGITTPIPPDLLAADFPEGDAREAYLASFIIDTHLASPEPDSATIIAAERQRLADVLRTIAKTQGSASMTALQQNRELTRGPLYAAIGVMNLYAPYSGQRGVSAERITMAQEAAKKYVELRQATSKTQALAILAKIRSGVDDPRGQRGRAYSPPTLTPEEAKYLRAIISAVKEAHPIGRRGTDYATRARALGGALVQFREDVFPAPEWIGWLGVLGGKPRPVGLQTLKQFEASISLAIGNRTASVSRSSSELRSVPKYDWLAEVVRASVRRDIMFQLSGGRTNP